MLSAKSLGFSGIADDIEGEIASIATGAMRETAEATRDELRAQTVSVGLGGRLPNTWTARAYPGGTKNSINPAGIVYSRAPDIMDAFTRGATIRPVAGAKYLWIPTKNVPRARSRTSGYRRVQTGSGSRPLRIKAGALTPEECENRFNTDFVIKKGKAGRLLAFMDLVKGRGGGVRMPTKGRLRQGRAPSLVLMFTLTRSVKMPKYFDLDASAERWVTRYDQALTTRLGR